MNGPINGPMDGIQVPLREAKTMAELFVDRAADDHLGVIFEGQEWTWAQVVAESAARAAMLEDLGLAGKHIGVLLDNTPEYLLLLGAAALSGSVLVGINHTRRGAVLAEDILHTDVAILYTDSTKTDIIEGFDLPVPVQLVDGSEYLEQVAAHQGAPLPLPVALPKPEDLYLLVFTSGSTGAPKAVRMSHTKMVWYGGRRPGALTAQSIPATQDPETIRRMATAFGPNAVFYNSMPMFHTNALTASVFAALRTGATVVFKRRFSASTWLSDIRRYHVTNFNYVGRALSYILAQPPTPDDADNDLAIAVGVEASAQDREEFERRFGCARINEGYTSSEAGINILPFPGMPEGALGRPFESQDVIVADPESTDECPRAVFGPGGELLNAGDAIGELVRRDGLGAFEGYYANDEADAERTRNGWFWSGDLAYRDEEGTFYFAGRGVDWLRVDSENFAAAPIERIITRHPDAKAVAVYAVPDPRTGDLVMAALEMRDGKEFDPQGFAEFLKVQPDFGTKWAPSFVRIVDAIPTTANGKVDRNPLRMQRWQVKDPVWWRSGRELDYRLLTPDDIAAIEEQFAENGRSRVLV